MPAPPHRTPARQAQPRAGFSLIETTFAMVIVGGLLAASVAVVGTVSRMRQSVNEQQMARLLAEDLMAEALAAAYEDPDGPAALGLDAGETASDRSAFDDVDDYHGWSSTPRRRSGEALIADASWTVRVTVEWVRPDSPNATSSSETGVKRITVQAARGGRRIASLTALRTSAWGMGS